MTVPDPVPGKDISAGSGSATANKSIADILGQITKSLNTIKQNNTNTSTSTNAAP